MRVLSVGTCGSDTHYYEHGRIGDHIVEKPLVLGHEASGEIVALGPDVETLSVGQRIAIEPGVPDFTCSECKAGRYNLCPRMVFFGTPPIDGAFAQYVLVHELCHLIHRNHARRFWREVEARCPDWRDERTYLHGEGLALKARLKALVAG